jgi:protein-tyrosine phosphatase
LRALVDLHCHLLPDLDDGPATVEESVALAAELAAGGVTAVVATPHFRDDHPRVRPARLAALCMRLGDRIASEGIELEVLPGAEVDLHRGLEATDAELRLVSLGQRGTDLLVETPYSRLGSLFEEQLFGLQLRGYRLLLAHPERNTAFQQDPDRLAALVRRGVLVQVTATSLARPPAQSRSGRAARAMMEAGLAHVIASDAHGPAFARTSLAEGLRAGREVVGSRADWMATEAPAAILAGEPLPPAPAGERRPGGLLRRRRS